MLDVSYAESFLKDLKLLKSTPYFKKVKSICFSELPSFSSTKDIKNLKKLEGHANFYRIRIGDYRIGLHIKENRIQVLRVLNRKEIYRYFP
ncbi:MAG: type II toxin-antitoxin system RelE/ParE family toxin [Bacteroidia bacterium]|jgi:mRNA-degrading endonuclease RelE of RelBE toxin-antitoxin system|nr:type II toxin-antitoxin system RelE/ParE family toxin [Bacteroidia bacterium]